MDIVKELRKKKGVQQKDLAIEIGVSQPTVSDWEANKKDPSGDRLKRLAEFFEVDELVILGRGSIGYPILKNKVPQTIEAKILAQGIDKLPQEKREQALKVVRAMFDDYADLFNGGYYDDNAQL